MASRSLFAFSDCVFDGVLGIQRPELPSDAPVTRFDVPFPAFTETPALDKILDDQEVNKDLFLAFVGRWFFDMGHLDDWGLTPAMIGLAGTGKTTILNALNKAYPWNKTGILSNVYSKFAVSGIVDCFSWIAFDVKGDEGLCDRLQTPGKMVVRRLRRPPEVVDWCAPGWMAGNETPEDCRNLQVFRFDKPIENWGFNLSARLEQELPHIVVRGIQAYHRALRRYGRARPLF